MQNPQEIKTAPKPENTTPCPVTSSPKNKGNYSNAPKMNIPPLMIQ